MFYRLPAEWEKQDAVQFTFPHADSDWKLILEDAIQVFIDVIIAILPFEKVIVVGSKVYLPSCPIIQVRHSCESMILHECGCFMPFKRLPLLFVTTSLAFLLP